MVLPLVVKTFFVDLSTIFASTLIIVFVYPLLISFYLPCWAYRSLVKYIVQKNNKFGRILDGLDGTLCGQAPYSNPDCVLLPCIYLADKLDVPGAVKGLKEKIIEKNIYPELQQKIVCKYGYHFWYNVENFRIENHVRNLNTEFPNMPVTKSELRNNATQLSRLPFDPERSPWEIIIVTNYIDEENPELKSVLMLRVNHCLMDGYSIYNFLMKAADKPLKSLLAQKEENRDIESRLKEICNFVMLLVMGPYYFLKLFVLCNDENEFVRNVFKSDYKDDWKTQYTSAVSKDRLRTLRDSYKVSMSALVTTLFALAINKTMERAKVDKMHKTMHGYLSYPMPGHKELLTNHWTIVKIPIQICNEDPGKTLKFVEKQFQSLRKSVQPLVPFYVQKMIALAPIRLRYTSNKLPPATFVLTNFPGPLQQADVFGCQWKQTDLAGKTSGGTAFMLATNSIHDDFWFKVASPACNLPDQSDVDLLSNDVLEILNDLESRCLDKIKKLS